MILACRLVVVRAREVDDDLMGGVGLVDFAIDGGGAAEEHVAEVCATATSEARIDGFSFEGKDAEDAFVNAAQRFVANEAFERFDT
jgi:hypothetical protein